MNIGTVNLGGLQVSRLIIGGNPFSGFSHQSPERSAEMTHYYSAARIKETLTCAERAGVDTHIGRADHHVMRLLMEHWDEGGSIQWIAQTCPEVGSTEHCVRSAVRGGAKASFIHGGRMDSLLRDNDMDEVHRAIGAMREAGLPAGVAGHNPRVFEWAEENVDVDFYMCCYYNPIARNAQGEHAAGASEWFRPEDRELMVETIARLSKPVIHYKIMAAGRNEPREAFRYAAQHMRPQDAVCVGIFSGDNPNMIEEDVKLLAESLGDV